MNIVFFSIKIKLRYTVDGPGLSPSVDSGTGILFTLLAFHKFNTDLYFRVYICITYTYGKANIQQ